MPEERDLQVLSENIRLITERKKDYGVLLAGQFREAVLLHAESLPRRAEIFPVRDAAALFEAVAGPTNELCSREFALFCREYAECFRKRVTIKTVLAGEETEQPAEPGKTAYLKNAFTDKAYRIFSTKIKGLTAAYYQGYAAACEEVYYGRSAYVILPIYNSTDGRLISFKRMLAKYDLKIAAACMIDMDEDSAVMYALAKKGLSAETGDFIDISVVLPDGVASGDFLTACEVFGLRMLLVNSVPLEYSSDSYGKHELNVHFYGKGANIDAFVLFLEASHIRYTTDGIYQILN